MNTQTQPTHKYKNSPLGLIPEDWEVKKFKQVAKFYSGGTPLTSVREYYEGDIPFIKSGEIYGEKTEQFLNEMALKNSSAKMVCKGDILYALYGANSGEVAVSKINGAINQAILCIKTELNNLYVFNFLIKEKDIIVKKYLQGGQGNLSAEIVKKLDIPIPPLPEQAAIANCLSTWDNAIEKQTALITQKELSKKALMQQLLSGKKRLKGFSGEWRKLKLGIDCELITKGTTPTSLGREFKDNGVNFIKIESLEENGTIIPNKVAFIDEQTHEMLKRSQLKENDILISIAGALGRVALVNKQILPANTNQALAIIRLKKESKLKLKYLYYFLNSPKVKKEIDAINVQAAQANLSLSNINDLTVLYPLIEEQTAIATILQCADTEIQLLQHKLTQLKEQKKGLMQVLLTGKKRLKY